MSRLARWLFYLAAATCGLATLAVAVLWVRSYRVSEGLSRNGQDSSLEKLWSADGVLRFSYDARTFISWLEPPPYERWYYCRALVGGGSRTSQWACHLSRARTGSVASIRVCCPYWAVLLPLLLVDAALVRRGVVRWRRRRRAGYCEKCGYNLTGNVSGICPECGTPTSARTQGSSGVRR